MSEPTRGTVALTLPGGWEGGEERPFELNGDGAAATLAFEIRPPRDAPSGTLEIRALATDEAGARRASGR